MQKVLELNVQKRTENDKNSKKLLENGYIPAIFYGKNVKNILLKIKKNDAVNILKEAGKYSLIDLKIDKDESKKVLIKEVQKNNIKDIISHIDFFQVDLNKKISLDLPFIFINEAPAVKNLGGILLKNIETVKIECLPKDIISGIEIDLTKLKTFEDAIKINDLKISSNIKFITKSNDLIVSVVKPRVIVEDEDKKEEEKDGEKDATKDENTDGKKDDKEKLEKNEEKKSEKK